MEARPGKVLRLRNHLHIQSSSSTAVTMHALHRTIICGNDKMGTMVGMCTVLGEKENRISNGRLVPTALRRVVKSHVAYRLKL